MASESPSIMALVIPSSSANSTALLATKASSWATVVGTLMPLQRPLRFYYNANTNFLLLGKNGSIIVNFVKALVQRLPSGVVLVLWCPDSWMKELELVLPIFGQSMYLIKWECRFLRTNLVSSIPHYPAHECQQSHIHLFHKSSFEDILDATAFHPQKLPPLGVCIPHYLHIKKNKIK